jgi:hypothetical protein
MMNMRAAIKASHVDSSLPAQHISAQVKALSRVPSRQLAAADKEEDDGGPVGHSLFRASSAALLN